MLQPQITAYLDMIKPTAADYIREYLVRMAEIRGTGGATKETSYYSALENILNYFGKDLRPRVICNGQLKNQGAGNPDFGLYTKAQIQGGEPTPGQIPERGVIEVKGLADKTWQTAKSVQATKYFGHYLMEHRDGVLRDWPRVPLPSDLSALQTSAILGQRIAALLDTETGCRGKAQIGTDCRDRSEARRINILRN